jgi:hypothetical protein
MLKCRYSKVKALRGPMADAIESARRQPERALLRKMLDTLTGMPAENYTVLGPQIVLRGSMKRNLPP